MVTVSNIPTPRTKKTLIDPSSHDGIEVHLGFQARGEERSDKMRLRMPRVNQVQSEDGSAVLTYEGLDTSHDLGGGNYLLRVVEGDHATEVRGRVSESLSEAIKRAADEGIDYSSLGIMESINYSEMISEKYGRRLQIRLFEIANGENTDVGSLAQTFCSLLFDLLSSYVHNRSEYPEGGEGYYPDEIYFCPLWVDRSLYMTLRAGGKSNG